jgi:hypothetical protein
VFSCVAKDDLPAVCLSGSERLPALHARVCSCVCLGCMWCDCMRDIDRQVLRFGYTMASSSHAGSQMV